MSRFSNKEEMKPLLDLCRQGKLFEVQEWIAAGKPVNPPPPVPARQRTQGPLEVAVGLGFNSLVQVLLEGGANTAEPRHGGFGGFCAIEDAVCQRRLDLVELLVKHGADIRDVPMWRVFDTWDTNIMRYFVERGADTKTDNPIAYAFKYKIRTALRIYKEYEERFPDWKRQLNIALRFHTKEQSQKWVSLMLWAGADPFEPGPQILEIEEIEYYDRCAVEIALRHGWTWMMEKIGKMNPTADHAVKFLEAALESRKPETLKLLIEAGFLKRLNTDQKSALIGSLIRFLFSHLMMQEIRHGKNGYSYRSAESACFCDGMFELLLQNGVKWTPDFAEIKSDRQELVRIGAPGFKTFVRLLKKYHAATEEVLHELTRTGAAQRLLQSK